MCFVCSAMSQKFWESGFTHGGLTNSVGQSSDFQTGGPSGNVGSAFLTGGLSRGTTAGASTSLFATGGTAQGEAGAPVSQEATATTQGSTGVQNIDALLGGQKWAGSALTFMFPNTTTYFGAGYYDQNALQGFAVATAAQQTSAKAAFAAIAGLTNMNFSEVLASSITGPYSPQVDITIARSSYPNTAYAYYPYTDQVGGDVWMGINGGNSDPVKGNYAWHTMWHELGHAMGLKHGHDSTSGVTNQALTSDRDGMEFSVMTYRSYIGSSTSGGYGNETWGYAQSFMMYDIAALQTMYGADFTTNSGNTTYTFSSTTGEMFINGVGQGAPGGNRVFLTIWDGNGVDTYDFSNYTTNQSIDLTPGSWSLMSEAQRANLGSGNYARANVYNALQYGTDTRSLIENAIGGSGNDTITGNAANNELKGGAGADMLNGGDGSDVLWGDGGADQLNGGEGDDYLFADGLDTVLNGGGGFDRLTLFGLTGANVDLGAGSIEVTWGTNSADTLNGTTATATVTVFGLGGNDVIRGGSGNDQLYGQDGADEIYGGNGEDWLYVDSLDTVINGGAGSDRLTSLDGSALNLNLGTSSIEWVWGSNNGDTLNGATSGEVLRLFGLGGNDVINGGSNDDSIYGQEGADQLYGNGGNDWIYFDALDTVVSGGAGTDNALVLDTTGTGVTLNMTSGSLEAVYASNYADTITAAGSSVGVFINGFNGNDVLTGGNVDDTIYGGGNDDTITGNGGNDQIFGNSGFDIAVYSGNLANYSIVNQGGGVWTVQHLSGGADGWDTLTGIERLQFADTFVLL